MPLIDELLAQKKVEYLSRRASSVLLQGKLSESAQLYSDALVEARGLPGSLRAKIYSNRSLVLLRLGKKTGGVLRQPSEVAGESTPLSCPHPTLQMR